MHTRDKNGRFARTDGGFCGTYVDSKGYLSICAGPLRGKRVHQIVMEAKLGRKLEAWEDVDHYPDANKLNCAPDNLRVIDHREHGWVSAAQGQFMRRKEVKDKKEWEEEFGDVDGVPI